VQPTWRIGIALLGLALAACASAPPTLLALPAAPVPAADPGIGERPGTTTVLLRPVILPAYLNAYPVVTGRSGNALIVADDAEWAEPLPDAVGRVLRDALSRRLGASRVLIAGDGRIPDADLSVEFLALDPREGAVWLDAMWSFFCTARDQRGNAGRTFLSVPLDGITPTAVAAATTDALGRLAAELATQAQCTGGDASLAPPVSSSVASSQRSGGAGPSASSRGAGLEDAR
jgi:hypothetical protein